MRSLALLKLGSTFPELERKKGDFTDWIARGCGLERGSRWVTIVDAIGGGPLPEPDSLAGAILTGSHHYVTDREPWSETVALWIRRAVAEGLPLLGVCYGHQLIAQALGGRAGENPAGLEFGTVEVTTAAGAARDPLFHSLIPRFYAHTCHAQTVCQLPPGATLLAASRRDIHQAFRMGKCCWGVQFHPEFDEIAAGFYLDQYRIPLAEQGRDPDEMKARLRPTPRSRGVLAAFAALADGATATI
jgi:GMP synthase (glutamine-hydrolysing)